jgi:hypothetical protein
MQVGERDADAENRRANPRHSRPDEREHEPTHGQDEYCGLDVIVVQVHVRGEHTGGDGGNYAQRTDDRSAHETLEGERRDAKATLSPTLDMCQAIGSFRRAR